MRSGFLPNICGEEKIISDLKRYIQDYRTVIFILNGKGITAGLAEKAAAYYKERCADEPLLILSSSVANENKGKVCIRHISEEAERILLTVYRMYEFSDRFVCLGEDARFGGIFNYVINGVLTWNEAFQAILGK